VTCQKCGNEMTFEFCAPGAILFKGPGFHATDYPKRP
jgi:predicted nucleic acid-binding Zn ribbon protein